MRPLLFGAKIVVSLALLYVSLRFVNFGALRERLNQIDFVWIAAALVILGLQIVPVSLRWQRIANTCGAPLRAQRAILYTLIGLFFSQVLPSTIGGDAARNLAFGPRHRHVEKRYIFGADRPHRGPDLAGRVGAGWLALVAVAHPESGRARDTDGDRRGGSRGPGRPFRPITARPHRFRTLESHAAPGRYRDDRLVGLDITATRRRRCGDVRRGAADDGSGAVALRGRHRLVVHIAGFGATVPPVVLIAAIPISIAGWGVRESAMLAAFTYAGLPNSDGVLISILFGAGSFIVGAAGGIALELERQPRPPCRHSGGQ